jgi:hypothetical protein
MKSHDNNGSRSDRAGDFMVRNPVCAALWQPLSFIRQTMLASSFSCLPVNTGTETEPVWQLVSDRAVAHYLILRSNGVSPRDLLVRTLDEARKGDDKIVLLPADTCLASDPVKSVLEVWKGDAVMVTREKTKELLGILTPYDLL